MSGHVPVMLAEVLRMLAPKDGEHYVDGTSAGGGYARAILEAADAASSASTAIPTRLRAARNWCAISPAA
ncbi:MAG: 16S rRNA (cytosine(1402)-N(4))-methyltransferase [Rhizomicrobium sp.]